MRRENAFDLLRIIASVAVILLHVSAKGLDEYAFGGGRTVQIGIVNLMNCSTRFAVPCFVMLSGAFLLDDDRNSDYRYFYKKSLKKMGIPVIAFSMVYFIWSEIEVVTGKIGTFRWTDMLRPVMNVIKGAPYYHMWYLYMLLGLYIMVPVIMKAKNDMCFSDLKKSSAILLIVCMVSYLTSTHSLKWDIGFSACFLGYFVAGYV